MGRVPGYASGKTWVIEGRKTNSPVLVARAIVRPEGARVPLRVVNLRDEQVRVPKQVPIAQMELLPEDASATIAAVKEESTTGADDAQHRALWELVNNSGDKLSLDEKEQLLALLLEFSDLFAKGPEDFKRTGKIKHQINTGGGHSRYDRWYRESPPPSAGPKPRRCWKK